MNLIRFSLQNRFAVLAVAIGLCVLGAAVVPGITIDILPDFKKPVVVSFFFVSGFADHGYGKVRDLTRRTSVDVGGKIEHQESRTVPGSAVIKVFFQPGADPSSAMNDIVNLEASDMFHCRPASSGHSRCAASPRICLSCWPQSRARGSANPSLHHRLLRGAKQNGRAQGVHIRTVRWQVSQMMVYVDPAEAPRSSCQRHRCRRGVEKVELVLASGTVEIGNTDYQVHPRNTLPTTEEIEAIPVVVREAGPVFLRDLARVVDEQLCNTTLCA